MLDTYTNTERHGLESDGWDEERAHTRERERDREIGRQRGKVEGREGGREGQRGNACERVSETLRAVD